ncbi:MAG: zinc-binding dehydrogenase [SAR202 cluster bacterium]|nr:zinc-binding dehydrogenase [SAR202 cluster bacterium]
MYLYIRPTSLLTRVPESLSPEAAVLVGGVMVNGFQWAIRMGGVRMGDYVLIQGAGQQGLACTYAARHAGAALVLVSGLSRDAQRLELARRCGAHRTIVADGENVVEVVRQETGEAMADVVVDVSGSPAAITASVDCLRRQGTLVLAGLTGDATVTPMLMDKLVWNEIRLQGTSRRTTIPLRRPSGCCKRPGSPSSGW